MSNNESLNSDEAVKKRVQIQTKVTKGVIIYISNYMININIILIYMILIFEI
jgi:hypothetical protein